MRVVYSYSTHQKSLILVMSDTLLSFLLMEHLVIQIQNVIYVEVTLEVFFIIVRFVSSAWIWTVLLETPSSVSFKYEGP